MAIEIDNSPYLVDDLQFGGLSVFVPLNETPSEVWLRHFRLQPLPGNAHRIAENGLAFHLDRNDRDVLSAMRKIATAIEKTNSACEKAAEEDEKAAIRRESEIASKREKIDRLLKQWWEEQDASKAVALPAES